MSLNERLEEEGKSGSPRCVGEEAEKDGDKEFFARLCVKLKYLEQQFLCEGVCLLVWRNQREVTRGCDEPFPPVRISRSSTQNRTRAGTMASHPKRECSTVSMSASATFSF